MECAFYQFYVICLQNQTPEFDVVKVDSTVCAINLMLWSLIFDKTFKVCVKKGIQKDL